MDETTPEEITAKYMKYAQVRGITAIVSGIVGIAGGILLLRKLREDKRTLLAAALIERVGKRHDDGG